MRFVHDFEKERKRMKSKLIFGLFAMTLILAFASASFAQINVQIFSSASTNEPINKRTTQTADPTSSGAGVTVSGSVIANAELTTTTITLSYGAPITSTCALAAGGGVANACTQAAVPVNDPIRIVAATGLFANVNIVTIRYSTGQMDITIPECKDNGSEASVNGSGNCKSSTPSGSFRIIGVRNDVNGKTAPMTVSANLSNNGNNYILTTNSGNTISALTAPIAPLSAATTTATVFTNGTIVGAGTATVKLTEGFMQAWRFNGGPNVTANGNSGGNANTAGLTTPNGDQILLTVAGRTTGQSLTIATPAASAGSGLTFGGGFPLTFTPTVTTQSLIVTANDFNKLASVTLTFTVAGVCATPVPAATWTLTAQMGPVCAAALDANSVPTAANGYPCYANSNAIGPLTLVNVIPAQTTMLIPYATVGGGYDTGIAIANTTSDPFGTATGGAIAQSGNITLTFFPQLPAGGAGTPSTLTTSATIQKPTGLTAADGTLAAGGSWTTLLSGLLPLATPPITGSFNGYIFVQTNFLDAHGVFYPTNAFSGGTFTAGSEILVLPQPISTPRTGTEALNN
jgi:hypothetical protein